MTSRKPICFKFINKYGFCVVENTVSIKATIFGFWIRRPFPCQLRRRFEGKGDQLRSCHPFPRFINLYIYKLIKLSHLYVSSPPSHLHICKYVREREGTKEALLSFAIPSRRGGVSPLGRSASAARFSATF